MIKLSSIPYYVKSIHLLATGIEKPIKIFQLIGGKHKEKTICLKKTGLCFFIRNFLDIWSIKETFLDDFYHFDSEEKPQQGFIIDIGAGIGEYAIQAATACPGCHIYGFEPFPESVAFFDRNIQKNSLPNVTAISAAVSSISGELVINTSSGNPLQFRTQTDDTSGDPVHTVQLMDFLHTHGIDEIEIAKIDCEGGEYDILLPLSKDELRKFKRIVMEYHNHLTTHRHMEIVERLKEAGFRVQEEQNVVHSYIGYIYAQRADISTDKI